MATKRDVRDSRFNLRLTRKERRALQILARQAGISESAFLQQQIRTAFDRYVHERDNHG